MKRISRSIARIAVAMSLLACATALANERDFVDLRRIGPLKGDADAGKEKAAVCSACHGAAGISPAPAFPNLAGQYAEYLYWKLVVYKREARPESPMTSQMAHLDDASMRDLAAWFASLPPVPPSPATDASSRGATLFREGDPTRGTPPCQGCHGADGRGHPWANDDTSYRTYPALRGQHAEYVIQRLKEYRDGKHHTSSTARVMTPIAQTLDDEAITAVAAWLQTAP